MSTKTITKQYVTEKIMTMAITCGTSFFLILSTRMAPIPGIENTFSITTEPPNENAKLIPTTVTMGSRAFRSAWCRMTAFSAAPFARAVLT